MGVIHTFQPDGKPHIHDVPEGTSPADVAVLHQVTVYEDSENRNEAELRIAKDPNGKLEWV